MDKKLIIGFLIVVVLSGIVYVSLGSKVRVRIDKDKSTFYVKNQNNRWVVSGREYSKLFDGTSQMNRRKSDIQVEMTNTSRDVTIERKTPYIRGPEINEIWSFDGSISDVSLFPVSHKVEVFNAKGKFYRYEVRNLVYDGPTYKLTGETELSFGRNMKVELEPNYRWGWVYKSGIVKVQYDIPSDCVVFNFRLFDPDSTPPLWNDTSGYIGIDGETTYNNEVVLYAKGYDETALDWAWLAMNETGKWVNHTDCVCYQESADTSTNCGGLSTGTYSSSGNWNDGSWSSYSSLGVYYVNYTISSYFLNNSLWQIGPANEDGSLNDMNKTIPSECWSSILQFKINSTDAVANSQSKWECYNGNEWVNIYSTGTNFYNLRFIYEEAMWWNTSYSMENSSQDMGDASQTWTWSNFTWSNNLITENTTVGWRIYYNDTSGNENVTSVQTFTVYNDTFNVTLPENTTELRLNVSSCVGDGCYQTGYYQPQNQSTSRPFWILGNNGTIVNDYRVCFDELPPDCIDIYFSKDNVLVQEDSNLVSYWKFDKGNSNKVNDSISDNEGTITGATWVDGYIGDGLSFDGSGDKINVGNIHNDIGTNTTWTISFWVNTLKDSSQYYWFDNYASIKGIRIFRVDTNKLALSVGNGTDYETEYSTGTITGNSWYHVAIVNNDDESTFYINGANDSTKTRTTLTDINIEGTDAFIGISQQNTYSHNGTIDEVRIYNRSLNQSEIYQVYMKQRNVSFWNFESNSNKTYDVWGINHGNNNEATWTSSGKYGGAYEFDGDSDYIQVLDDLSLNITDELTLSAWVSVKNFGSGGEVIRKGDSYIMRVNSVGTTLFYLAGVSDTSLTGTVIRNNTWVHLAMVYNTTHKITYVNGTQDAIEVTTGSITKDSKNLRFGLDMGTTYDFNGTIDEVMIFDKALSSDEIELIYNNYNFQPVDYIMDDDNCANFNQTMIYDLPVYKEDYFWSFIVLDSCTAGTTFSTNHTWSKVN